MSDDFAWETAEENGELIVKQVFAVAVYRNVDGDMVIRQQNERGDEDSFIGVPEEKREAFIDAICNA